MESLWKKIEPALLAESKSLEENIETEVCIIGGGITGISTAYNLIKQGKKVVILDRNELADKVTGHTTAKITSQHGLFYNYLIEDYGIKFAKKYYLANEEAIKNIEETIEEENIDCDFEMQSAYIFTKDAKELEKIRKEIGAVKAIKGEAEFVKTIDTKLKNIQGAIEFPNQAQFNPRKYLKGLVKKIVEEGGRVYENSKVIELEDEDEIYRVDTEKGINMPGFYFMKMYQETSYAIAVETKEKLFQGMYLQLENPRISLRTAKDGNKTLVIIGGMDHRVGAKIDLKDAFKELEKVAKEMYPDAKVLYRWNTQDCITLDKIPYIGEFSKMMPGVFVRNRL